MFRNESPDLSSKLIRSAVAKTVREWGPIPGAGLITFVDPGKTESRRSRRHRPGHCFRMAGWREVGVTKGGHGRPKLVVLMAPQQHVGRLEVAVGDPETRGLFDG